MYVFNDLKLIDTVAFWAYIASPKETDMTKKQFIWLVIRFIGIIYLIRAVYAFLAMYSYVANLIHFFPYDKEPSYYASYVLIFQGLANVSVILIAVYLLFCGKIIYRIVNRTSRLEPEAGL